MKAKKAKDLVNELIGDILGDAEKSPAESSSIESDAQKPETPKLEAPKATATAAGLSFTDETLRLGESKIIPKNDKIVIAKPKVSETTRLTRLTSPFSPSGAEASLTQSENLKVAQNRIFDLEQEIERLRRENEQLAAAAETIRKRAGELAADNDSKTKKLSDLQERLANEKEILEASLKAKDRELKEVRLKIDEFEMRLYSNLQKIRVRERELENRLEIVKLESTALARNKDEVILDLKRQIDQSAIELDNFKSKGQELNRQINEKQETLRRTVKALRLALTMLEGGGDDLADPLKKAK